MIANFRKFEAGPDPFGHTWKIEFRWLQTAISIRHADAVDVKFALSDDGPWQEKVIALDHAHLRQLSAHSGRALTDPWCTRLAAAHLVHMIETCEDMEKTLVTPSLKQLETYAAQ